MSFLSGDEDSNLDINIKRGFSYGPRTFLYTHGSTWEPPFEPFENDGFEAQLEVTCTKGGESVFVANSEDSGSGLIIDPDTVLVTLELSPEQTEALDFSCCRFVLFIYKGDVDDPDSKIPLAWGDIFVKDLV